MAKVKTSGFGPADDPMFHQGAYLVGVNESKTSAKDSRAATKEEPQTQAASSEDFNDESLLTPLSKEQLRNLLGDFLDQLATSQPPVPASVSEHQGDNKDQRPEQAPQPVETERPPTPGDLFRAWQQGGKEKLREVLRNMPEEGKE